jgi:hypothetical protein
MYRGVPFCVVLDKNETVFSTYPDILVPLHESEHFSVSVYCNSDYPL